MATKTETAILVLKANAGKSLADVIPLLMQECDLSEKNAHACYRLRVKADPSLALTGAIAKVKVAAPTKAKFKKEVKAETLLPASEVAKIKQANLARLKAVSARDRKQYTNVARPEGPGVEGFDADGARAEVSGMIDSLESFKAPKFLSKAQVKALV